MSNDFDVGIENVHLFKKNIYYKSSFPDGLEAEQFGFFRDYFFRRK